MLRSKPRGMILGQKRRNQTSEHDSGSGEQDGLGSHLLNDVASVDVQMHAGVAFLSPEGRQEFE